MNGLFNNMPYGHLFFYFANHIQGLIEHGGYFILVILTVFEGIPLVGMLVPGHVAIIAAGFLAKIGVLNLCWVIVLALVGAFVGDYIGFYIGRRYGMSFITRLRRYIYISDNHLNRATGLLSRHTFKAMIISRFTPATRALMPFLIGTTNLKQGRFILYNIIGAIAWVVSSVILGYVFGASYHFASKAIGRLIILSLISGVVIAWGYRFINMRFHIFRRYELITLTLNIIALIVFFGTVEKLTDHSFKLLFDVWVNDGFSRLNQLYPNLHILGEIISGIGGVYAMLLAGLVLSLYYLIKKRWRSMAIVVLSLSSTAFMVYFIKGLYMNPRPYSIYAVLADPSFPSGHAALSAAFLFALAYLLAPRIHSLAKRELMIVVVVIFTVLVGLSRLILGVHWGSDIIAGWALGIFLSTASVLFIRYASFFLMAKNSRDR